MSIPKSIFVLVVISAGLHAGSRTLEPHGYLLFEAEDVISSGTGGALVTEAEPSARGGRYVILPNSRRLEVTDNTAEKGADFFLPSEKNGERKAVAKNGEELRVHFSTQVASTLFIWVRVKMPAASQEYLAVQLDDGVAKTWWDHTVFPPLSRDKWVWHHADSYQVTAGDHTLTFERPMPGMGLDAIAVSANPAFCPKLARAGCIYLDASAGAAERRGIFEFDVFGDLPATVWCKTRRGAADLGGVAFDGATMAPAGAASVEQGEWTWHRVGEVLAKGGAHRIEVTGADAVGTVAICAKRDFTPADDPYYTGAVTITGVAIKPDREFKLHRGYRVDQIPGFTPAIHPVARSLYGGRTDQRGRTTGFFHTEQIDGRWTFVDPEGCLWLDLSVNHFGTEGAMRDRMLDKYGSETKWANETADFLRANGFNAVGYHEYSNTPTYKLKLRQGMPYFVNLSLMLSYARSIGLEAGAGNVGYRGGCILPFDPAFADFCDEKAKKLAAPIANDPFVIGYYLDNEMPIPDDALVKLLALPESDSGHQAALKWLADQGIARDPHDRYAAAVLAKFFDYMLGTYLRTAIAAIRKYDPNHLICGIRANAPSEIHEQFLRTIGRYVDVVSINYYMRWTADPTLLSHWLEWSGKPVIISEWYAKGMDTRFANEKNAGWVVKTQRDRGSFYQNFTLSLLQHPAVIGFNWFRLYDDDANDVNKGILDDDFRPYIDLVAAMREVNVNAYELLDYLEAHPLDTSFATKIY